MEGIEQPSLTKKAIKAFTNAQDKASMLRINILNTELLSFSIIDMAGECMLGKKIFSLQELNILKDRLSIILNQMVKSTSTSIDNLTIDGSLNNLLKDANMKKKGQFISIDLLSLLCLQYLLTCKGISNNQSVKDIINRGISELKTAIEKVEINSPEDDDSADPITKYATELVDLARNNKLPPVIGRENEIRQIFEILAKKTKSNAILVGKPGVGKTAIVNGLAHLIAKGVSGHHDEVDSSNKKDNTTLDSVRKEFKIYNVDLSAMVAGSEYRGSFEKRLKELLKEAESDRNIIMFFDEIHMILGAGSSGQGTMDAANILKPALASGQIKVIGATTSDEYRKHVQKDPAFERRFVKIIVKEPSVDDALTVLRGLRNSFELHHGIRITDQAMVYAAQAGKRYIPGRRLPDLAIDLIDTACASTVISYNTESPEIQALKNKKISFELARTSLHLDLDRINENETGENNSGMADEIKKKLAENEKDILLITESIEKMEDEFYRSREYLKKIKKLKERLHKAKIQMEEAKDRNDFYSVLDFQDYVIPEYENQIVLLEKKSEAIQPFHIAEVISRQTGIPVTKLNQSDNEKMLQMEERIKENLFGQDDAVSVVCDSIIANRLGLNDQNRPIGTFLFVGPTGVGKTELSKLVCKELNSTVDNMLTLDMSDYSNEISVTKLIGASAGYIGYNEGGTLTEPIKEMPYTVVLLDEVDLAHQRVLNILYQLLDEGRVTDGKGEKISFLNAVIIMTTNLGSHLVDKTPPPELTTLLGNRFGMALLNRIDNVVCFQKLDFDALKAILLSEIRKFNERLMKQYNVFISMSDFSIENAVIRGQESEFGGRVLKRFVKDKLTRPLSKILLKLAENEKGNDNEMNTNTTNVTITHIEEGDDLRMTPYLTFDEYNFFIHNK